MKQFFTLVVLYMLVGCKTVGNDYQRPEINLPAQFSQAVVTEGLTLQNNWWVLFDDAKLTELIEEASQRNPNVGLAVARIEEAEAAIRETGASGLPTVELSADTKRERVTEAGIFPVFASNPRSNYRFGFNAIQEIEFWGRLARATEASRATMLATQYAKNVVMWSLSSLAAYHYLLVRSYDAQLGINQQNQKNSEASLALAKHRLAGGVVSVLDVHQAQLVLDNLSFQAQELTRLRALSEHQLAILSGNLQLKLAVDHLAKMPISPMPPTGLPSDLLENRPDVRQSEQHLIAANANIGVAKAAFYPSISLTGALGSESIQLGDILKSAARIWSLGLNLNLPIFNVGRLDARLDQASAKQKQALANYQITIQNAFREVNDALVNVRQYREREKLAISRQDTTQKMLNVVKNRYRSGYSGYLEVLEAQRSHHDATQAVIQSRENVLIATVALFKALGGGWQRESN